MGILIPNKKSLPEHVRKGQQIISYNRKLVKSFWVCYAIFMTDIFCQIIAKKAPAKIEYEDDEVIAFWDIKPSAPVHILIVPKKHYKNVKDFQEKDEHIVAKLILVSIKLAKKLKIDKSGYRLVINNGKWAGQIVPHVHVHLMGGSIKKT